MSNNEMISVPRELTPEMREAFHEAHDRYEEGIGESPDSQWRAMLRAAPKSTEQPQGDPVALPERKDPTQYWVEPGGVHKAEGWNACLDEIAKLNEGESHGE
ncbi:hypothetical protein G7009_01665 [Pseudomonas capeferrum]|uniref:hypothetical protein n=1 Tax=Pseudomonas capeferrum TaxID=1495066 RepID=UPI0015E416A8|nr:hypothetical protein [Pseudomonas capeferrum]MBA1200509.1 hypothetical protein [Pseudomonas capeferrum]